MRVAIIGSRDKKKLNQNKILENLPQECTEIVSGGAVGVDSLAKAIAADNGLLYTEFLPDYDTYGRQAPLLRNRKIADYSDLVLAFWDNKSPGTKNMILYCLETDKPVKVIMI